MELEPATIIVDEVSMVDVPLMAALLSAIASGSRLVLVGDADQLPSVGPGNVLADVIASKRVRVVRLTTIFRQLDTSRIVQNAHRILHGELPEASPSGVHHRGDFHIIHSDDADKAQRVVLEACCERIPKSYGLDPVRDIQVLSPMHRGTVGTIAFNALLQARLNPKGAAWRVGQDEFRVGDKVMQVRNDYDRDVFNGDVGYITEVDREEGALTVMMNDTSVRYEGEQVYQLRLAYCVSIHKSQGSEYPAVVIPLLTQHYVLLQRNLLYTAVTRAKSLVVIVGSHRAIELAVSRADQAQRKTLLAHALRDVP